MKYLQGAMVMVISNLLSMHIQGMGAGMLISSVGSVFLTLLFVFAAHFVVNFIFAKRAEG